MQTAMKQPRSIREKVRWVYGPVATILVVVPLLQWHSIAFWQAMTGELSGIAWSVALEIVSLWLWFRDDPWPKEWRQWYWFIRATGIRIMAVVTTCILLAGPLYNVSAPLFKEAQSMSRIAASLSDWTSILNAANQQGVDKAGSLAVKAVREKERLRNELDKKQGDAKGSADIQLFIAAGLQFCSLIVLQWAVVLSISALARNPGGVRELPANPKTEAKSPEPNPLPPPRTVEAGILPTPQSIATTIQPIVKTYSGPNSDKPIIDTPEARAVNEYRQRKGFTFYSQVAADIDEQKSTLSEFIRGNVTAAVHGRIHAKLAGNPQSQG